MKNSEEKVSKKTTKRKAGESPLAQNLFGVSPPKRTKKSPPKTTKSEKTRSKRQEKTNETTKAKEKPLPSLSVSPKKLSTKRKSLTRVVLYSRF